MNPEIPDDGGMVGNFGWFADPVRVSATVANFPVMFGRPADLMEAAPDWIGDGKTGDIKLYMAYYEVAVPGWKAQTDEPPYLPQPGNDCTAESTARGIDLLQMIEAAAPTGDSQPVFDGRDKRACIEAIYAYGLDAAGMWGDRGCYGAAIAEGAQRHGVLGYKDVEGPDEVDSGRLRQFARDPAGTIRKYGRFSEPYKVEVARITTWEEACAWWANRGVITIASNVGFATPRDERGICRRQGVWPHQMVTCGCIRSDGIETAVVLQSWGPDQPTGPRPFQLPSFAFRILRADFERILAQGDCWGYRDFTGFQRTPVPARWTYDLMA